MRQSIINKLNSNNMSKKAIAIYIGVGILIGISICYFVGEISDLIIKLNMID